jgi:hypothetical protein
MVLICTVFLASAACAVEYQINWYSINSGGGEIAGGGYMINCSVGQSAAGLVNSTSLIHWIGFWAGEVPTPTVYTKLDDVKKCANGDFISVAGKIATTAPSDFEDFFYLEELKRSSGIRVAASTAAIASLARGSVVNVIGTVGTTPAGERQIVGPIAIVVSSTTPLAPIGMTNRYVGGKNFGAPPLGQYGVTGGKDLNNVGLLIRTWGKVTYRDAVNKLVTVDDGSGPVWVDCSTLASVPVMDEYLSVIGISSLYKPGSDRLRHVLPRIDGVPGH